MIRHLHVEQYPGPLNEMRSILQLSRSCVCAPIPINVPYGICANGLLTVYFSFIT